MKETFKIRLDPSDITAFIEKANTLPNDINLFQGETVVSGKSIMGICALNFNKDIYLLIRDRTDDRIVYQTFGNWIVDNDNIKKVE